MGVFQENLVLIFDSPLQQVHKHVIMVKTKNDSSTKKENTPKSHLELALTKVGLSNVHLIRDLGYFRWGPPNGRRDRWRSKQIQKATVDDIQQLVISDRPPDMVIDVNDLQLPIQFRTNLTKQLVASKYPFGNSGIGTLLHAKSKCDLGTFDFCLGSPALEILSAERKTGKGATAPFLVMKVPGTRMILARYQLNYVQDYSVPGFQFERILTGKRLEDHHDIGLTKHVQLMRIGRFQAVISGEADGMDSEGNAVEFKLMKPESFGSTRVSNGRDRLCYSVSWKKLQRSFDED